MQKKKSLGQHFLKSRAYLRAIADAAGVAAGERVLEVGPGDGALTSELLARGARVIAVEKDARLIPILKEKFKGKDLELLEGDVLDFEIPKKFWPYKIVANIPYYITGALLRKFLSGTQQPSTLVFLVQKEVAERIARSKKESILSLSVKVYGTPTYIKTVPRGAFAPMPAVDSAILLVSDISRKKFIDAGHEQRFFELVKKGFSQKRKFLKNNLGKGYSDILKKAGISEKTRAEDVALGQWLALSKVEGLALSK